MAVKRTMSTGFVKKCDLRGNFTAIERRSGILEIRKEKSRDAARSRRGKENYEFYELAKLLPLPAAITSQLDKASIIRLTISYLKLRDFSGHGDPKWTQDGGPGINKLSKGHQSRLDFIDPFESRQGTHILQSLDGFAFILANDGRFLYISETVSIYLGLSQVEMAGSSIFEYVHPQDHTELAEHLGMCLVPAGSSGSPPGSGSEDGSSPATPRPGSPSERGYIMVSSPDKSVHKSFALRMKSTLTKRGVHVKTSGYRVVHVLGTLRPQAQFASPRPGCHSNNNSNSTSSNCGGTSNNPQPQLLGLVGMAIALPPPTITELRLELDTFITRLSPDFKVIYCEPIISDLLDMSADDVTDRLLYDLCHVADLSNLRRSHLDILSKGQALTDYYRWINRNGGYVWIQTCATTLLNNKNADDQSILAINFVVSGLECKNCAMDLWQLTGDVTSSMSSSSNSQSRQEKLNELKSKKSSASLTTKSKIHVTNATTTPSTPSVLPDDQATSECRTLTENTCPKLAVENSGEESQVSSPEKSSGNLDSKTKRRKMENPRKRKQSNCDSQNAEQGNKAAKLVQSDSKASVITSVPQNQTAASQSVNKILDDHNLPNVAAALSTDCLTSSPEDLSVKRTFRKSPDRNIIQHSSVFKLSASQSSDQLKPTPFLDVHDNSSSQLSVTANSVKELEAAMNRHLPSVPSTTAFGSQNDKTPYDSSLTEPQSGVKGFSGIPSGTQQSSSSWLSSSRTSCPDMLTASNFLRSLYANRESVIKTNSRSQPAFLNNDPPASLLTPPEPDPGTYRDYGNTYPYGKTDFSGHSNIYDRETGIESREHMYQDQSHREQFSFIPYKDHIPAAYIDHISSSVYKDHFTSHYKELSPYKDIIPAFTIPSLMSPAGRLHQAYSSFHHHFTVPLTSSTMDACSITPPSSNSPDLNKQTSSSHHYDAASYTSDLTDSCNISHKSSLNSSLSPNPSASPTTSGNQYQHYRHQRDHVYQGVSGGDSAKSGYYGVCATAATPVYMDLNQNSSGAVQYEACTRPVLPWY